MPAQRVVRRDGLCDHGRILRHPVVYRLPPVAIGPTVEAPVANRGQIVGRGLIAQAVALVDHGPEHAGRWLPCHAHRIAQASCKDAVAAIRQVKLIDGCPAFLDLHAIVGDIAERADTRKEFLAVGAGQQAPRPMPAGLEADELAARRGDAVGARRVGERHHAVGIADIERVTQQRHAERLVQSLHESFARFGDAVAIRVAQQSDAVRADAKGGGPPHRRLHRVTEHAPGRSGDLVRLGHEHVAIGQHVNPARVFQAGRKRVDLEPWRRHRHLPVAPSPGRRHLERRDHALRLRHRHHWRAAPRRLGRGTLQPPPLQRGGAEHRDYSCKNCGKVHFIHPLIGCTLYLT